MHRIRMGLPLTLALALLAGCGTQTSTNLKLVVFPHPYLPIESPRATIVPRSQNMKLAVLNCVDQTGRAGNLVEVFADMISTELQRSGRFELADRGQLRQYDYTQVLDRCEKASKSCDPAGYRVNETRKTFDHLGQEADALLFCSITAMTGSQVELDYRLVNSMSFTVMHAGSTAVPFENAGGSLKVTRTAIQTMAATLRDAFPKPEPGKRARVLVQDGRLLTIGFGKKDGLIAGMNVFVVSPGRVLPAQQSGSLDESYLAQAYVVSVYEHSSQVVVFRGEDFRVGDDVRFK